ncbi:hypothetical protein [Agromyces sp. H66]|uniref:hypothetical protein n=1 Tax=Agromyces sp. H66 TaxID=2529859 RepID=UPI0010A9C78F|nr:hypothetical protein [Agromyces sp. H66]
MSASRASRDRRLNEGATVLAEEGAGDVRIDRIAALRAIEMSFHLHFAGVDGYKKALLDHMETMITAPLRAARANPGEEAVARSILGRLTSLPGEPDADPYGRRLEVAPHAWAAAVVDAAMTRARTDSARLAVLRRAWSTATDDEERVRLAASLPYVVGVGATDLMPPREAGDIQRIHELIHPLVPGCNEDRAGTDGGRTEQPRAHGGRS